jgi:hypothetical protein
MSSADHNVQQLRIGISNPTAPALMVFLRSIAECAYLPHLQIQGAREFATSSFTCGSTRL